MVRSLCPLYVILHSEYTKNGTTRIVVTHKMYAIIPCQKVADVLGSIFSGDDLWFDSRKQPPLVSDHLILS